MTAKLSIIIPLAKDETAHHTLLKQLPEDAEIITVSEGSRAKSLNKGAEIATGEYLWFLHADSRLSDNAITTLLSAIEKHPNALHFFTLAFDKASPAMRINEFGVKLRANLLKIPFGDQGFCISRDSFNKIGEFDESSTYGEDHLFLWKARQNGIKINPLSAKIYTSPRKYKKDGWLKTTSSYQYLWIKQAIPEIWKLLNKPDIAIAIFVKTPELSPVKTRLAAEIGDKNAQDFYLLSVDATKSAIKQCNAAIYWAVAEKQALYHPLWQDFNTIHSGTGELGNRLNHVYSQLLKKHDIVILIGSDTPHITKTHIQSAINALAKTNFVMGKSEDGGFYLFAGKKPINKQIWLDTEYSVETTSEQLAANLQKDITYIEKLTDIDDLDSLKKLKANNNSQITTELKNWLESTL